MISTIYTLWLREMKKFVRNKSRLVGSMAFPVLFLVVLGTGFSGFFQYRGGVSYVQFIGPGIIGMTLLFSSMFGGLSVLWDRQFGFLKEILVAPVSRVSIMAGKTIGTVTTSMIKGCLLLAALAIAGLVRVDIFGMLAALVFMFVISAAFVALGIAAAALMSDPHGFQLIMNFLIMPVFFLSGALFPLEGIPEWLSILTKINPLTYGIDGMRFALGGPYEFSPLLDLAVLVVFSVVATLAGAFLFERMPA
ncbi:ABC transporter permease [Desulfomonile tiedjei]|uniref:Transport permease protein n=1 Tax=Desulfomonile tiedjei (strain ATCC 49306 / DSM 6799 / DCB-1) TaxID=706587 RepID=I4C7J2_DESTA|nr:ABC transporter permease [Desulfomonile tiedjei]AFM25533.1 daunorubicin resistance ABC transporter membrane protein [Desulfomonile tiedjei DSM 6799]